MQAEEFANLCQLLIDDQPAGLSDCESLLSFDFDSFSAFLTHHRSRRPPDCCTSHSSRPPSDDLSSRASFQFFQLCLPQLLSKWSTQTPSGLSCESARIPIVPAATSGTLRTLQFVPITKCKISLVRMRWLSVFFWQFSQISISRPLFAAQLFLSFAIGFAS